MTNKTVALLDRFLRTANQMGRDAFLAPLELSLVKEAQPWGEKRYDRRGFVHFRRECRRRSRLVVVFQNLSHSTLAIWEWNPCRSGKGGTVLGRISVKSGRKADIMKFPSLLFPFNKALIYCYFPW